MFDKCQTFFSKTVKYDANIWILFLEDTNRYLGDKQKLQKNQCIQLNYICSKVIESYVTVQENHSAKQKVGKNCHEWVLGGTHGALHF